MCIDREDPDTVTSPVSLPPIGEVDDQNEALVNELEAESAELIRKRLSSLDSLPNRQLQISRLPTLRFLIAVCVSFSVSQISFWFVVCGLGTQWNRLFAL
jgi:hypothetical protein